MPIRRNKVLERATRSQRYAAREIGQIHTAVESKVAAAILDMLRKLMVRTRHTAVSDAVLSGRLELVESAVPVGSINAALTEELVEKAYLRSARMAAGKVARSTFALSAENPVLRQFVAGHLGRLVSEMVGQVKQSASAAVVQGVTENWSTKRLAGMVRRSVGLTPKQLERVFSTRRTELRIRRETEARLSQLEDQGKGSSYLAQVTRARLRNYSEAKIDSRTRDRMDAMREQRAKAIARTETTRAINQAQVDVWDQAIKDGTVERGSLRKTWVAIMDDRVTDICQALHGTTVPIDGQFNDTVQGLMHDHPPAHVNCRSVIVVQRG